MIPDHPDHVVVARDDPQLKWRVPVHRILLAKPGKERVRVRDDRGVEERVQVDVAHVLVSVSQ